MHQNKQKPKPAVITYPVIPKLSVATDVKCWRLHVRLGWDSHFLFRQIVPAFSYGADRAGFGAGLCWLGVAVVGRWTSL